MSRLFADTDAMRQKASELINLSAKLTELAQQINRLENSVSPGAYDGQLYGAVRAVINGAEADAMQMSALVGESAKKLVGKAQEFEAANSFAADVMDVIFLIPRDPIVVGREAMDYGRRTSTENKGQEDYQTQTTKEASSSHSVVEISSLVEATPLVGEECAIYAQRRRPDLGAVGTHGNGNYGAGNYIEKFQNLAFQTSAEEDLTKQVAKGYAVVWPIGQIQEYENFQGNQTYGHIAIIERVEADKVFVSQAGWPGHLEMEIPVDVLSTLYVLRD